MMLRSELLVSVLACALTATPAFAPGGTNTPLCRHPADSEYTGLVNLASTGGVVGCARPAAGSVVTAPPALYSHNGVLNVRLNYVTSTDAAGRVLFCFVTPDGLQSPTLHVKPGDTMNIVLTNLVAAASGTPRPTMVSLGSNVCGAATGDVTSVNMHFHGTNVPPTCHADEVLHTTVNSGQTFRYSVTFPLDEPSGIYWYHPHVHGMADPAVLGGASGLIVVDGIEASQPTVAGLPERDLIIRDQNVVGDPTPGGKTPSWDVSLNYVPIAYPAMKPAIITVNPGGREFWRVLNASADTIADVELTYDGVNQTLEVVGLDGVPTGSQDGTGIGKVIRTTHILLAPASRAEFVVTAPGAGVKRAVLMTRAVDTGPYGDSDPSRTLAVLKPVVATTAGTTLPLVARATGPAVRPRFFGLDSAAVSANRTLYFSEDLADPAHPDTSPTNFYVTVDGAKPVVFSCANPPAITTTQGAVEAWTIQNRSLETHEFHIHQIHFQLLAKNGLKVPPDQQQFYDTIQVPYWKGTGPYPSVTVLLDFRGNVVGDFVYHCHILGHEDNGMMATIRVLPTSTLSAKG